MNKFDDYRPEDLEKVSLPEIIMLIFTALFLLFMIVAISHLIITQIFF